MKQFLGLLKKEWVLYRSSWVVAIIAGFVFLTVAEYYSNQQIGSINNRLLFTGMVLMIGSFFVIFQFSSSIRSDLKTKETWLHSTSSMAQLISVKMVFTLVSSIIYMTIFLSIGLFASNSFNEVSFIQILFLLLLIVVTFVFIQLLSLIIVLLFLTINIHLRRFLGRFAFVFSIGIFFIITKVYTKFHESSIYGKIFYHGEYSLKRVGPFLPEKTFIISLGSRYVVEELATILVFFLLFILAAKWLEKAVLR